MRKQRKYQRNRKSLGSTKLWRIAGFSSLGMLGVIGVVTLMPVSWGAADALDNSQRSANTRLSVDAAAVVGLSLGESTQIEIKPSVQGAFKSGQTPMTVTTNNPEGYSVYLKTADGGSALKSVRENAGADQVIESITADTAGTAFTGNTWGVTWGKDTVSENSTFKQVPTTADTPIIETNSGDVTVGTSDTYYIGFGAHIDTNLPAGEYTNEIVASVIANPMKITSLSDLVFMQDMTPEICANTASAFNSSTGASDSSSPYYKTPVQKQLYDLRDGKKYYVAKLADGNCWMTQNLAYDLKEGAQLTDSDTDMPAGKTWTVPSSTETEIPEKVADDNTLARSWNLGEIVLTSPTTSQLCPKATPPEGYEGDEYNSAWHGQKLTETCPQWYKDVSAMTEGYTATETSSIDGNTYDGHYLIGNYYQWNAVTAGSGVETDAENMANGNAGLTDPSKLVDAKASICPKGWKLPTSGAYDNAGSSWPYDREDSFYKLLHAYGYPATGSNVTDAANGWVANGGYPYTAITGGSRVRLDYSPMSFVRSGNVYSGYGSLRYAGLGSYYWSSFAYPGSSQYAYGLGFNTADVLPAYHPGRVYGFSARCLAR